MLHLLFYINTWKNYFNNYKTNKKHTNKIAHYILKWFVINMQISKYIKKSIVPFNDADET